MNSLEIIKEAIGSQKPIEFDYNKDGKPIGRRTGNPHAVYRDSETRNINVDIYQTKGVSSQPDKIPDWRVFTVEFIDNARILNKNNRFNIADGYDSNSSRYIDFISKI